MLGVRRAAALAGALAMAGTLAGPVPRAQADVQSVGDTSRDVMSDVDGPMSDRKSDIKTFKTNYRDQRVILRTDFRAHPGDFETTENVVQLNWPVKTPDGLFWVAVNFTREGTFKFLSDASGPLECDGMQHFVNPDTASFRLVMPRECIGRPKWIRTGAISRRWLPHDLSTADDNEVRCDDARADHAVGCWEEAPRLGARIQYDT